MLLFLMSMAEESDRGNIEAFYNKYKKDMMKYARSRLRRAGRKNYLFDAEDAVQATFFKIIKYISKIDFDREEKAVKNYIFSILTNEINKILRKKENFLENVEEFSEESIYNLIEELEIQKNYKKVIEAISKMDEIYSITLMYVFIEEKSVKEIASLMGISQKTVYTSVFVRTAYNPLESLKTTPLSTVNGSSLPSVIL